MEVAFEDLVVQQFPPFVQPLVKEGLEILCQNATLENVTAIGKKVADDVLTLSPKCHMDKLSNLCEFADFIDGANGSTKAADIVAKVSELWTPLQDCPCDDPLNGIAGDIDSVPKMLAKSKDAVKELVDSMFHNNLRVQCAVLAVQFALLGYLWAQSKRTDKVISKAKDSLKMIETEWLVPAMKIIYVTQPRLDEDDEKYVDKVKTQRQCLSPTDVRMANLYLKGASDLLDKNIAELEDHKQASYINAVMGAVSTAIFTAYTGGLFHGTQTLYRSTLFGSKLFLQQAAVTSLSAAATAGLGWMTVKHLWNAQQIEELLENMKTMKGTVDKEIAKLDCIIGAMSRER